jgi:hypothetical protein
VNSPPGQITLVVGKVDPVPADDSGAVRVCARRQAGVAGAAQGDRLLLWLEATPEPKLRWQGLRSVHITKALDDQGQSLGEAANENAGGPPPGAPVRPGGPRAAVAPLPMALGAHILIPVWLKTADKESRSLKEFAGTITADLEAAAKDLISVKDFSKAVGKTFEGPGGSSLKVLEASGAGEKDVRLRVAFTPAENVSAENNPFKLSSRPLPLLKGSAGPLYTGPFNGLSLVNTKGEILPVHVQVRKGGRPVEYEIVCPVDNEDGTPARLVYSARKTVTVDIPFKLKDCPLR